MKSRITLVSALHIIKRCMLPIDFRAPPFGTTGFAVFRYHLTVWVAYVFVILSLLMAFWDMYINIDDTLKAIKIASETFTVINVLGKMIVCHRERFRLESLIKGIEDFMKRANQEEKDLIQTYVDKCYLLYGIAFVSAFGGPLSFLISPLLIPDRILPTEMTFPFDYTPVPILIACYIWDILAMTQVGCMMMIDIFFAILLWYTAVRFCMLCREFERATSAEDISRCVAKHQELLGFVDDVTFTTRRVAVIVTGVAFVTVSTGGLVLIQHTSMEDVGRYIFFELAMLLELFMLTWPADHLIEKSRGIGMAAYGCNWIGKSPKMLRDIMIVVERSKVPVTITVDGLLPPLSLEFYRSAMTATFSYITTLRAYAAE